MTLLERELRAGDKEVRPADLDKFRLGGEMKEKLNTAGDSESPACPQPT